MSSDNDEGRGKLSGRLLCEDELLANAKFNDQGYTDLADTAELSRLARLQKPTTLEIVVDFKSDNSLIEDLKSQLGKDGWNFLGVTALAASQALQSFGKAVGGLHLAKFERDTDANSFDSLMVIGRSTELLQVDFLEKLRISPKLGIQEFQDSCKPLEDARQTLKKPRKESVRGVHTSGRNHGWYRCFDKKKKGR